VWSGTGPGVLIGTLLLAFAAGADPSPGIDYLTVEANEGDSSGGHAAIRFGELTYHFQHSDGGFLRIVREGTRGFRRSYTQVGNRSIRVSRLDADPATREALRSSFDELFQTQRSQLEELDSLRADARLADELLRRRQPGPELSGVLAIDPVESYTLRGGGLFALDAAPIAREAAPSLAALRRRVDQSYGLHYLRQQLEAREESLKQIGFAPRRPRFSPDELGPPSYSFSMQFEDGMLELLALEILLEPRPLTSASFFELTHSGAPLTPREMRALADHREDLVRQLVRLVRSTRPDRGFPLLVGIARLQVLDLSLERGRFVFLDAFADEARVIASDRLDEQRAQLLALRPRTQQVFDEARRRFADDSRSGESAYAGLEAAGNRLRELEGAIDSGRPLRVQGDGLLPSRSGRVPRWIQPRLSYAELSRGLEVTREAERAYHQALRRHYRYNLVTHNCVSEIFRTVERGLLAQAPDTTGPAGSTASAEPESESAARVRELSEERLGGYVDPVAGLHFVPFVSARAVTRSYRVREEESWPGYRQQQLTTLWRHLLDAYVELFAGDAQVLSKLGSLAKHVDDDGLRRWVKGVKKARSVDKLRAYLEA